MSVPVSVHQPAPDRTLAVWLDSTPDLSSTDSTQAYWVDGEHQPHNSPVAGRRSPVAGRRSPVRAQRVCLLHESRQATGLSDLAMCPPMPLIEVEEIEQVTTQLQP
jgi:hypothetical protein